MKTVTITKAIIEQALTIATSFTDQKDDNASCIFVSIKDSQMAIEATNFGESIRSKSIPCKGEDVVRSAVDGKRLLQFVKAMNSEEITLTFGDDELIVKQGRTRFKISIMATNSIKEILFPKGDEINLNGELLNGMERIAHSIDANNPNHNLSGLLLDISADTVTLAGTDTKRLSAVKYAHATGKERAILLPKRSVQSMIKLFSGHNIKAFADDVNFTIETETVAYTTRLIAGKFPDWKRIVPRSAEKIIEIDSATLAALASQAFVVTDNAEITIKDGELTMTAEEVKTQQSMSASFSVTYESSEEIVFGVNVRHLVDYLSANGTDVVKLYFTSAVSPLLFHSEKLIEVMMPVVLSPEVRVGAAA